eukprot:699695-Rhodomonas_salina.1
MRLRGTDLGYAATSYQRPHVPSRPPSDPLHADIDDDDSNSPPPPPNLDSTGAPGTAASSTSTAGAGAANNGGGAANKGGDAPMAKGRMGNNGGGSLLGRGGAGLRSSCVTPRLEAIRGGA